MISAFLYGLVSIVILIPGAVWLFNWMLRQLDRRAGIDWPSARKRILDSPYAPVYFGARIGGVAYIVGQLFGKIF